MDDIKDKAYSRPWDLLPKLRSLLALDLREKLLNPCGFGFLMRITIIKPHSSAVMVKKITSCCRCVCMRKSYKVAYKDNAMY